MNLAFVSRERRDKQISVDRESYGDVTEADFWDIAGDVVGVVAIQCFGMLKAVAIANYRSLRHIAIPLQKLNVLTGANGSGKSSFYRALRLLADTAQGRVVASQRRRLTVDAVGGSRIRCAIGAPRRARRRGDAATTCRESASRIRRRRPWIFN